MSLYPHHMRSSTLRNARWLLIAAGGVDLWTVAQAPYVMVQIGAGAVAAIMFIAAGLLWERYTPTLADNLAHGLFGTETATEGLIKAASEIVAQRQDPSSGSTPTG